MSFVFVPSESYTLHWNGAAHATSYQLSNDGTSVAQSGIRGTSKGETAPNRYDTTVPWYVRACGPGGCSAWSSKLQVITEPQPGGGGPQCPPICTNPQTSGPGGAGPGTPSTWRYTVGYAYDNTSGALKRVYDAGDGDYTYWTLKNVDATGAVSKAEVNGSAITVRHIHDRVTDQVTELQATGWVPR